MHIQQNSGTTNTAWQCWCRLCAKRDGHYFDIFIEQPQPNVTNFLSVISEFFHVHVKPDDGLPLSLCTECCTALTSIERYAENIKKVQEMYKDFKKSTQLAEMEIKDLYKKYDIAECKPLIPQLLPEAVKPVTTSLIEEIIVEGNVKDILVKDETTLKSQESDNETESQVEPLDPLTNDENIQEGHAMEYDSESSSMNFPSDTFVMEANNDLKYIDRKDDEATPNKNSKDIFTCNICQRHFERNRNYVWHMKTKHAIEISSWKCQQCPCTFRQQKDLKRHVRKIHDPSVYPCPHCSRTFKLKKVFENHIRKEHEGQSSFICEECGESVRSEEGLVEHMAIHTGRGAFECKECGKHFAKKTNFKMHLQTHGDKHVCGECGAKLTTSKALRYHMKVHSDEMPYKCDYCGRRFKRTKNLKSHLITHTGLKPFSCDFCDKTFSSSTSCRYHKKHLHPNELAAMEAAGIKKYTKNIPKISVLRAITQQAGEAEDVGVCLSNKKIKLPKLDAELSDALND